MYFFELNFEKWKSYILAQRFIRVMFMGLCSNLYFQGASAAIVNFTIDPYPLPQYLILEPYQYITPDINAGVDFSPLVEDKLWFGIEGSVYSWIPALWYVKPQTVYETGWEFGLRSKLTIKEIEGTNSIADKPRISLVANPNIGYAIIMIRDLEDRQTYIVKKSTRVGGIYLGGMLGAFIKLPKIFNFFLAAGAKYYFLPKEKDEIRVRRSGFYPDIDISIGFMF